MTGLETRGDPKETEKSRECTVFFPVRTTHRRQDRRRYAKDTTASTFMSCTPVDLGVVGSHRSRHSGHAPLVHPRGEPVRVRNSRFNLLHR